jgi:SPP1 family predicted phage head-tail adaptor
MQNQLRIGNLRHRVTIQSLGTRVDDGAGGGSIPFADVATVWAEVHPLTGREQFLAGAFNPALTHRVTIRYRPGIKPSDRIVYGTRVLDIKSVADVEERHRQLEMLCEELVTW